MYINKKDSKYYVGGDNQEKKVYLRVTDWLTRL